MLTLAIETTGEVCSIAAVDDAGVVVERAFRHRMHLLQRLVPDTLAVIADAGTSLASVDLFAVSLGPGSFTGVRVGVMTAKVWADAYAKPLAGIGVLEAIAYESVGGMDEVIVPVVRARPGEVYAAAYVLRDGRLAETSPPRICPVPEVAEITRSLGALSVLLCGDGLPKNGPQIVEALSEAGIGARQGRQTAPRASTIAAIAQDRLASGQVASAVTLAPLYIAPPAIRAKALEPQV